MGTSDGRLCLVTGATGYVGGRHGLTGFERAVELVLSRIQDMQVATRWSSASTPGAPSDPAV
jgi:hypothetical protein